MAANLSGQVVSGPLSFDTPADYLQLHYDLDADKLDSTLVKLSQTVAKNAKVTNGLKDEIGALRSHIDNSVAKLQRSISVLDDGSRALKEQLHRVYDEVKAVQGSTIKRQEYDVDKDLMWREHHASKRFIEEYEASKGHIERVQAWVRDFLPSWYAGVSKAAADALERRLQSTTDETREAVARDVEVSTAAVVENTKNLAVMLDSRCGGLEAKQTAFGARVDDIDTRVGRQQRLLTSVTGSVDEIKEAVIDSNGSMDELRAAAAADLEGALALLGFGMADVRRLVDISVVGADRPPTAGSPSPRERAITPTRGGLLPPRPSSSGLGASTPTRASLLPEPHAEVSMNSSGVGGGSDRRAQGRRLSSSVDLSMQGARGTSPQAGSVRGPRTVAVSVRDEEAVSDFLATLPAFRAVAASVRLSGQSWGLVLADTVANARLARAVVLDVTAMIAAARLSGRLHPSAAEGVRVTSLTEGSLIANVTIAVEGSLDDVVAVRAALVAGFSTVPLTAVLPSTWLFYQSEMSAVGIPDVAPLTLAQPGRFVVIAPVGSANATTAAPAATLAPAERDDEEGGGFSCDLWFCGAFIIFVVVCLLCVCAVVVYLCTRPAGGRADERKKSQTSDTVVAPGPSDRPGPRRSDEGAAEDSRAPLPPPPPPPARPPGAKRGKSFDSSPNPIAMREADAESLDIMTPTPWEFEPAYDEAGKDAALRTPSFLRAKYPPEKHPRGPSWQRHNPQEEYAVAPPAFYDARRGAASESALVPPSRAASEARFLPVSPSPERPRDAVHRQFSYMSTVSQLSDTATPQPQRQASTSVASAGGRQRGLVLSPPPPPPRAHHHHQGPRPPMSDTTEIVDVLAMTPTDPFSLGEPGVEVAMTPVTGPARQDLGRRPGSSAASTDNSGAAASGLASIVGESEKLIAVDRAGSPFGGRARHLGGGIGSDQGP